MKSSRGIYDEEGVQLRTRRRMTRLAWALAGTAFCTLLIVILWQQQVIGGGMTVLLTLGLWLAAGHVLYTRMHRLQQVAWCIKFSDDFLIGYDYARRPRKIKWKDVERVEIQDDYLHIQTAQTFDLFVPASFSQFGALSHELVDYAFRHGIPLFINGVDFEELDVYEIYPFLQDDAPDRGASPSSTSF